MEWGKWGRKGLAVPISTGCFPSWAGMLLLEKAGSPLEAAGFSSTEDEVSQVMSQHNTGVGQGKASTGCPEAFKC